MLPINYISDEIFRVWDYYKIFPFDGGGYFVTVDLAGGTDDKTIALSTPSGKVFEHCMDSKGRIEWEKYDRWDVIEKGVWLNRWYYLASCARIYWLTKDERYAKVVTDTIGKWSNQIARPDNYPEYYRRFKTGFDSGCRTHNEKACSIWCDFQLAQRILHSYWIKYFIKDSSSFTEKFQEMFAELTFQNAEYLFWNDRNEEYEAGNHQMVRAFALLHAAAMFRESEHFKEWWQCGINLMDLHAQKDFTAEGISKEGCFSYLLMIMSLYVHAKSLIQAMGMMVPTGWSSLIKKMSAFLLATATPAGTTPVINDGYAADIKPFLQICNNYGHVNQKEKISLIRYPDSAVIVISPADVENNFWLLVEWLEPFGHSGHWHAGKPTVHLWLGKQMLFGDCGCPNYDDELYGRWYRRAMAHYSVTVDGKEDAQFISDIRWGCSPDVQNNYLKKDSSGYSLHFKNNGFMRLPSPVEYTRKINYIHGQKIIISDILEDINTKANHTFCLHIPFIVPDVYVCESENKIIAMTKNKKISLAWNVSEGVPMVSLEKKPVTVGRWRGMFPYVEIKVENVTKTVFTLEIVLSV